MVENSTVAWPLPTHPWWWRVRALAESSRRSWLPCRRRCCRRWCGRPTRRTTAWTAAPLRGRPRPTRCRRGTAKSDLVDWLAAPDAPPARAPPPFADRSGAGVAAGQPSLRLGGSAARRGGRHPTGAGWRWAPCRAGRGRRGRRCRGRRRGPGSGRWCMERRIPRAGAGGTAAAGAPDGRRDGAAGGAG